jgi:hypothetical protein
MRVPVRIQLADSGHAFVRANVQGPSIEFALRLPGAPKDAEVKTEGWK